MFGSGFDMGFTLVDLQTAVGDLLGNAVIIGLVAATVALALAPRIVSLVKRVIGRR